MLLLDHRLFGTQMKWKTPHQNQTVKQLKRPLVIQQVLLGVWFIECQFHRKFEHYFNFTLCMFVSDLPNQIPIDAKLS